MTVPVPAPQAYSRREQFGWFCYDWANSAFSTTVVTVFFGPYVTSLAKAGADAQGLIYPLGIPVAAASLFPYLVSLSVALQVVFLPLLGAVADYSQRKKPMLALFTALGAGATLLMATLENAEFLQGAALFVVANLSFGAAIVFYNAFLPEIAPPEERDAVSSRGWAMGYFGGGLLLGLNLALFANANALGLTQGQAVRISLGSAGLWWGLFSLVTFRTLRTRRTGKALPPGQSLVTVGFQQFLHTLRGMKGYPQTLLFLVAYLLYNDGIQTVISMSSQFGAEELRLGPDSLTRMFLMVQFVAFGGALLFNFLASKMGAKRAILLGLLIWTGVILYAYFLVSTEAEFFAMGFAVGLVMGGTQALSRSVFSQMIPVGKEAEYFSLYEISDRGTSWLGPLLFGLALQFTNSYRVAIVSLLVFFIVGSVLLSRVNVQQAAREAGNQA